MASGFYTDVDSFVFPLCSTVDVGDKVMLVGVSDSVNYHM